VTEVIVTIEHVRAAHLCARGARKWFSRYGLDYSYFLNHGYPVAVIENTGDEFGKIVADVARKDTAGGDFDG
jgi:hypothetical protein